MATDVIGEINFFGHTQDGSPLWMDVTGEKSETESNYVWKATRLTIEDLRGKENMFDLDTNGFEVHTYDGNVQNLFDPNSDTQKCYYDEIAQVLKNRFNATRVIVFNHRFRHRGQPLPPEKCDLIHRNPIFFPHVDNDPSSAYTTMKDIVGEEESKNVAKKRFQIINVWRPLGSNPVVNIPLTICDYQSLDPTNDVHESSIHGSVITGSLYMISYNGPDTQKWYYMSEMKSNEMFLFKIFDSNSNVARYGAHTAFINEKATATDTEQCSIELRCLVIYDD